MTPGLKDGAQSPSPVRAIPSPPVAVLAGGEGDSGKILVACASFIETQEEAAKARADAEIRVLADFAMVEAKVEAAERAARDRAAALEAQERACVEMMRKLLMQAEAAYCNLPCLRRLFLYPITDFMTD
jgi:hypothetical protein